MLLLIGFYVSHDLAGKWGKDPKQIVIDEYSAFLIPLFFTPMRVMPLLITFISFRIFDILKPPPLRQLEKLPGGWGIMLDDIGAAIYSSIVILLITRIIKL
ncbi:hypothetical protein A2Y85_01255 [candidate division WOR-3 bacterium RBG_13_43_14]|uniref:YutG/PgpA domain-containing protein n=1 Tax=candidate division WOR-3 bacterium RBG_13_43_14 TaxID=1802590 RepID=A0A1F4UDX9_UNCW3|nr:MAG: hypothetical protein A2Y85_01255 [candidate division WOR-3 bacterium RBG_13_43_14]